MPLHSDWDAIFVFLWYYGWVRCRSFTKSFLCNQGLLQVLLVYSCVSTLDACIKHLWFTIKFYLSNCRDALTFFFWTYSLEVSPGQVNLVLRLLYCKLSNMEQDKGVNYLMKTEFFELQSQVLMASDVLKWLKSHKIQPVHFYIWKKKVPFLYYSGNLLFYFLPEEEIILICNKVTVKCHLQVKLVISMALVIIGCHVWFEVFFYSWAANAISGDQKIQKHSWSNSLLNYLYVLCCIFF
jgi:hypothetical protein